jgi:hypothetical protein
MWAVKYAWRVFQERMFLYPVDIFFAVIVQAKLKFGQELTKRVLQKDAVLCAALLFK